LILTKVLKYNLKTGAKLSTRSKAIKPLFPPVNQETALKIAQKDAKSSYRDLSVYNIRAKYKEGNWHVDFDLKDPQMPGGGPHYIICGETGIILTQITQ